jgi:hypothetical protein
VGDVPFRRHVRVEPRSKACVFGIFFPILWIFGAFMSPPERVAQV